MTLEFHLSIGDQSADIPLHDEIKRRAYELLERGALEHEFEGGLKTELPRVLYAAGELAKYANAEVADTRSVRAARVYLYALSLCIDERRT